MPDTKISQLPAATATAVLVVPVETADGTLTSRVTCGAIAALGGGQPGLHASTHATGGSDAITPASIGAVATSDSRLTDSRMPTSHASTHASNGADAITPLSINAADRSHIHTLANITDAGTAAGLSFNASGDASPTQVVRGGDSRLTNSRAPTSHASSHRTNGADAVLPVVVNATLSTSTNDWGPGVADVVFVTPSAALNVTGLSAASAEGMVVLIVNVHATNNITLVNESSSSTAANRFVSSYGGNYVLYAGGGSATLVYQAGSVNRWRIL